LLGNYGSDFCPKLLGRQDSRLLLRLQRQPHVAGHAGRDGANVIAEATGGVEAYYTRGINILWDSVGAYYLFNAHGDVVAIAGAVTKTAEYDAFGNVTSGGFSSPFMYCGECHDCEKGTMFCMTS